MSRLLISFPLFSSSSSKHTYALPAAGRIARLIEEAVPLSYLWPLFFVQSLLKPFPYLISAPSQPATPPAAVICFCCICVLRAADCTSFNLTPAPQRRALISNLHPTQHWDLFMPPFEPERYDDTRPELTFRTPLYPTYLPNAAVSRLTPRTCASSPGLGTTTFFPASHIHNHHPLAFLILAANLACDNTSPQSTTLSPGIVVVSSRYSIDPNPSSCALLCFAWAVEGNPTSTLALRPLLALCSVRRRRRL